MYTIILFYIIGYFVFLYFLYKDLGEFDLFVIFFPLFQSVLFALAGFFIAIAMPVKYETTNWSEKIVALKDNNSVSGSFLLGTGMINGQMRYVYYQLNNDSTYKMWQANYYDASIKYTNGQPKIDITDISPSKTLWNKFAIDIDDESRQTYVFEVPQGSIKNNYELDAQ